MRLQDVVPAIRARWGRRTGQVPDIDAVRSAELRTILGPALRGDPREVEPWGLALSGGGIRSATFGLGVLQALARHRLLGCFHYQSTVSGGGYIGAFLQAMIRRHGVERAFDGLATGAGRDPSADTHPAGARALRHLREYSNYLAPRKSLFSGDTLGMLGTYVRNVLLVQAQLCALILALCLLPLVLHAAVGGLLERHPAALLLAAGVAGMAAVAMLAYVGTWADRHPGTGDGTQLPPRRVVLAALGTILSLALGSMLGAFGLARHERLPDFLTGAIGWLPPGWTADGADVGIATAALYLLLWHAWLAYSRLAAKTDAPAPPLLRHPWRFALGTAGAAAFAGVAIVLVRGWLSAWAAVDGGLWHVMVAGPLLVAAAWLLTAIVHLGLAGPAMSDLQREIWARVGGKTCALVAVGMTLSLGLTIYGPWLLGQGAAQGVQALSAAGWAGALAWLATTGVGLLAAYGARAARSGARRSRPLELLARLAPWLFVFGLLVALSLAGHVLLRVAGPALERLAGATPVAPALPAGDRLADYLAALHGAVGAYPNALPLLVAAALALWLLLGWAVDLNEFSLNAFYRNRLVRCYLGASNPARNPEPTTNFDLDDDLLLADLVEVQRTGDGVRPLYPLICTALNLVAAKQLDWQDRKAASFCLSPGWCGYLPPDSRPGEPPIGDVAAATAGTAGAADPGTAPGPGPGPRHRDSLAASLTLGGAIAISGAAVNPNMGYHSSPAVTFLLTLFDARLGWWLPNPRHPERPRADDAPFFGRWLLAELLGRTHAGGKFVHLSDGGHFENLGLYELVRRRCRFILCADAGADGARAFADLGNAVHKCRVDFGADIVIDVSALAPRADGTAARSCAVGRIAYADGSSGTLLYLKPTLTGEEPADVLHYARSHPCFPHEPTSDQFFDEAQFESYRRLGEDTARRALEPAFERLRGDHDGDGDGNSGAGQDRPWPPRPGLHDSPARDRLLAALRQHWAMPTRRPSPGAGPGIP